MLKQEDGNESILSALWSTAKEGDGRFKGDGDSKSCETTKSDEQRRGSRQRNPDFPEGFHATIDTSLASHFDPSKARKPITAPGRRQLSCRCKADSRSLVSLALDSGR